MKLLFATPRAGESEWCSPAGPVGFFLCWRYHPNVDYELIKVVLQAITSLSIAGGFIYGAVQFRDHRRAQHVANFTKLVELQMELRRMRVDDPSLAQVYRHDVIGLKDDRAVREYFFNLMQLSVFEIVWFSYRNGQLPRDYFEGWERRMMEIASEPSFRVMMGGSNMKILHEDFHQYMLGMLGRVRERDG